MGTLFLVSTPIGNMSDITLRAIDVLSSVDCILCEDTRRTGLFLHELSKRIQTQPLKKPKLLSYYDQIENLRLPQVIDMLEKNQNVALVSDAGTPLVSDPGFRLVEAAQKRGIPITAIPGASAILTALILSGLPTQPFTFLGYVPDKQGKRSALFSLIQKNHQSKTGPESPTYIFYVAPHKLLTTLNTMENIFGDIPIVIARELTKVHEQIWQGDIHTAKTDFAVPKGEFVLLFHLS